MSTLATDNPKVPAFLRLVVVVECTVVAATAIVLFFSPALGKELWAWGPPPFNARYIGAIYFSALAPLMIYAAVGRWAPGRLVQWMILTFTGCIAVAMFVHPASFEWDRWAAYGFWFLYIFIPLNSAVFLYLLRRLAAAGATPTPDMWQYVLTAAAAALGVYGLGLFIAPEAVTAFWPWPIDAFHGRIYAATFITPAVGAWLIRAKGAPSEHFTLGVTLFVLGVAAIAGVMITSPAVPVEKQVNYAALGTWTFFAMNAVIALVGGGLMWMGRALGAGTAPHLQSAPAR